MNDKKADLKKLFAQALKTEAELDKVKEQIIALTTSRSNAVQAIFEATGSKGPFKSPDGRLVTIRTRSTKDDEGNIAGQTWFFVGQGDNEVIVV